MANKLIKNRRYKRSRNKAREHESEEIVLSLGENSTLKSIEGGIDYIYNDKKPEDEVVSSENAQPFTADSTETQVSDSQQPVAENPPMNNTEPEMSNEEMIRRYVIFDGEGKIAGLREGAPEKLRKIYMQMTSNNDNKQ